MQDTRLGIIGDSQNILDIETHGYLTKTGRKPVILSGRGI